MRRAVFPGSFDPFTIGHLDVVRRGLKIFDEVIVAVAHNSAKSYAFSADERVAFVLATLAGDPETDPANGRARVVKAPGLVVDTCVEYGAVAILKGLRGGADFNAEVPMALMNRKLTGGSGEAPGIETVFIVGDSALNHIASSLVKDIARFGGDVTEFVAAPVAAALTEKYQEHQNG